MSSEIKTGQFEFEKFNVYIKAEHNYAETIRILADSEIDRTIKDQLRRASLSIVLNIAEGAGKFTKNDKKNFYIIAKGSVNECVALVRIMHISGVISEEQFLERYSDLLDIAKMLSGLISSMLDRHR